MNITEKDSSSNHNLENKMEKTKEEEVTSEKNKEEQTSKKSEAKDNKPDMKAKADAMYAKYKAEKKEREKLEKKLNKRVKSSKNLPEGMTIETIVEVSSAIKDLDPKEQSRLLAEANQKGIPLSEARKDEDFLLWRKAHREKVEKENKELKPSTKQKSEKSKSNSPTGKTLSQKEEWLKARGLYKEPKQMNRK